ncbi:hypothetical protein EO92_01330 [Methanosarcina sp. 2.H.A.1B.4]|jgi:hypothetical protein|nr:hypothetical protein EO92_01330 [Methanosarcina sp. 2.H.A.1B.4]
MIICTLALGGTIYAMGVGGGGAAVDVLMISQHDVFGPQPENITQDVQERAQRVENSVYNALSGQIGTEGVSISIESEIVRSSAYSISYKGDDFEIHKRYRNFLREAKDVVSITESGNLTNQTTINKIDKELAQMEEAKQELY